MVVAALIEPLAVTIRACHRLRIEDKTSALIIGDGPIGLLMTILMKRAGVAEIALIGGRNNRLTLAQEFEKAVDLVRNNKEVVKVILRGEKDENGKSINRANKKWLPQFETLK